MNKKKNSVRVLNQKVKRKEGQNNKLKNKHESSDIGILEKALTSAEKNNRRFKERRKVSKDNLKRKLSASFEVEKDDLKKKLAKKEEEVKHLQNVNLELEEQLQDITEGVQETRRDGRTYSSNMRMMVCLALCTLKL